MNLYQILANNRNGAHYTYWIEADRMELSPVGRGVQFYINNDIVLVVDKFNMCFKRDWDFFDNLYKKPILQYEATREQIMENRNSDFLSGMN